MGLSITIKPLSLMMELHCPDCEKVLVRWDPATFGGVPRTLEINCSCGLTGTAKLVHSFPMEPNSPMDCMIGYFIPIRVECPDE